jgi:predicted  nucleic acid-binding Zn-ribbon protein
MLDLGLLLRYETLGERLMARKKTQRERDLEAEVERFLEAIDNLIDRIRELEHDRDRNRFEIETLHATIADLRRQVGDLRDQIRQLR